MTREQFLVDKSNNGQDGNSWLTRAIEGVAALTLIGYALVGAIYLFTDHEVVTGCHPSNGHVHIIWPTDIWVYVLVSIMVACVVALWLVLVAAFKMPAGPGEVTPWCGVARRLLWGDSVVWEETEPLDWRLMWGGLTLSGVGITLAVLAFWGYVEVFVANPWCDNKEVVFKELDLVKFGRVTFWLQLITAVFFFFAGWVCWSLPFALEAKRLLTENGGQGSGGSYGTPSRGAMRTKR